MKGTDDMIIVMANGCFDLFHVGHLRHLEEARAMGDRLIVSLTTDQHVRKSRLQPFYKWEERAEVLRGLRCVDEVVPSENGIDAIVRHRPNIFVKGSDWNAESYGYAGVVLLETCQRHGVEIRVTTVRKQSVFDVISKAMA